MNKIWLVLFIISRSAEKVKSALVYLFQLCSFKFWKKFIPVYWWIVIVYAMFNLFVVYMYQLDITRVFLHKYVSSEEA